MIVAIDTETAFRLRGLKGSRLVRIVGHRYPSPPSYDHVQLVADDGTITLLSLRSEDVTEVLEVCCFTARALTTLSISDEHDSVQLADFRIDEVLVLRRAEWLDVPEQPVDTIGGNAQQQRFGFPGEAPPWTTHALVDAGIMLVDDRGSSLLLQADAFPLVIQCHYSLSSAKLPQGEPRGIES